MKRIYLIIIAFQLFAACGSNKSESEEASPAEVKQVTLTPEQIRTAGIEIDSIRRKTLYTELKVNGMVDVPPQNIVSISFPLGGYLKSTQLLPGSHVNKGEVIGIMEDPALVQLQQDYLMASARLKFLQQDLDRQKLLNENKVSADKILQQAESDFTAQKVLVKGYSEKLRLIGVQPEKLSEESISRSVPIRSPISGFVSKVNVNIGKYVNPADVLFELINPDDMHAALTVFEKDIALVKPKQHVLVTFVDEPGREYECEVLLVTRNVDDNRSALVHCHFETQPDRLLPGMFLNARIKVGRTDAWALPSTAVVRFENQHYLIEATSNNQFELLQVDTGTEEDGWTQIKASGDELAGRRFIISNPYPVLSMLKGGGEEE